MKSKLPMQELLQFRFGENGIYGGKDGKELFRFYRYYPPNTDVMTDGEIAEEIEQLCRLFDSLRCPFVMFGTDKVEDMSALKAYYRSQPRQYDHIIADVINEIESTEARSSAVQRAYYFIYKAQNEDDDIYTLIAGKGYKVDRVKNEELAVLLRNYLVREFTNVDLYTIAEEVKNYPDMVRAKPAVYNKEIMRRLCPNRIDFTKDHAEQSGVLRRTLMIKNFPSQIPPRALYTVASMRNTSFTMRLTPLQKDSARKLINEQLRNKAVMAGKQRYISQIMTSKTPARSCEDLDEATLTYAEVKALCAGNPLIKEKMDLDNEVARLSTLCSAHNAQIYELQDLVSIGYPAAIRRIGQELDALRQDAALFQSSLRKDDKGNEMFSAVIQGVTYTKRADADAALLDACKAAAAGAGEKKIGRYCGFDICVGYDPKIIGFAGYLQGEQRYRIELNPKQNFSSFRAVLENISAQIPVKIAAREEIEKNIESAKEAAKQPFAYEEEFQTKLARLNELNILLDQEKQEPVQNKKENPMQKEEYQDLDEFLDDGKIVPANQLPAGWQWEMYNDGSGSLHGPNSERFYSYDLAPYATSGLIEYNATGKGYDTFEGSLDRFREWAEQQILQELKKEPLQYQEFLEHQSHQDGEIEKNPLDMEDAARQAGLTVQRDQDKPGAAYFDADQNVIHVSDAGSEEDVRLSELKGYADAVIQRTATVEQPVRDLESASLAVMLAARYDVGVSDRLSQQLASAHAEAVKYPTFDLPVTLQRLDKALDYCDHFLAHEQERALEQEAENEPEPEQETELSPQSQAFMMDL